MAPLPELQDILGQARARLRHAIAAARLAAPGISALELCRRTMAEAQAFNDALVAVQAASRSRPQQ